MGERQDTLGGKGDGVFLAHVLSTMRKWPRATKLSLQTPPLAICPQNPGARNLSTFLYKSQRTCKLCISIEYDLGFALGKKNKSFALASVCFIVQPLEALVRECLCRRMWLRMRALCAKEARFLWLVPRPQLPVTRPWASTGSEEVSHLY